MYQSFRPLLMAAILGLSTFSACQKAQVAPDSQAALLVGRWYLTQSSGGISGSTQPADPRQAREVAFGADGQVQELLNGTPIATGTYTLTRAMAATTQRTETFINYTGLHLSGRTYIAELSPNALVFNNDNPDGLSVRYQHVLPTICLLQ